MPYSHLLFRDQARQRILAGATALADAVRVTLGPKSKSVIIQQSWGTPLICNDGVTIAKRIKMKDPDEDLGAQLLRQAAERTGDVVGDGTTTSTLLAHAMYAEGLRNVVAGASAIDLKHGLDRGMEAASAAIREMSRPITSRTEKAQVATVSAHNDPEIGELVADAVERVGVEGVVSVEEAKGIETTLDVVEGMQFDRGYLSPYFVTDAEKMQAVLESPLILVHEKRIGAIKDIVPLLEQIIQQGRPLLVIAEEVEGEALATMVLNKLRGAFLCVAVKAPGFGDRRQELLQDIALVSGAQLISEQLGKTLAGVAIEDLGSAQRVIVDKDTTTIVGGAGKPEEIKARCAELRRRITETTSDYDKEKLQERLAKLAGGVALIRVGAPSEAELKSRKEGFDDAISATQAAVAEGIVPGGGVAYLRAAAAVERLVGESEGDERTGLRIVARALETPARQIAENSGADAGVVIDHIRGATGGYGFDAARGTYGDLIEAGIMDPTKVVRVALQNAVSVAGTLLLAEATLTDRKDEKEEEAPHKEFA
ncbi:MAG: chaperonin GroEL [Dehalococcoidia bacterium]|nr:chaperonin GroEL [Dehalococcoidia bacterium]